MTTIKKNTCIDLADNNYADIIEDKNYILSYDEDKGYTVLKLKEHEGEKSKLKKFDAHIILSKKQIYLMELYSGCDPTDATDYANTLFEDNGYDKEAFKDFKSESTGLASDLNLVLKLGFETLAKMYDKKIEKDESLIGYLEL